MIIFKKIFSIIFRIGISAVLLVFLFKQIDKKNLCEMIRGANKLYLFVGFAIFFGTYLLSLLRWEMLLKAADIRLPLKRIIMSFSGCIFFSLFLPSTIGGDLVRSIDLAAHTKKAKEVVVTIFLDRLSGYSGLVVFCLSAVLFGWGILRDKAVLISVLIITFLLVVILSVLFNGFIYSKINKFLKFCSGFMLRRKRPAVNKIMQHLISLHNEIHHFNRHKGPLLCSLAFSFVIQAIVPLSFYFIALSFGLKINILYLFIFLPIIAAITILPVSIGGLGLRDASIIYFLAKAGVSKNMSFAMSLISFSFVLIYGCLGGIIYVLTVRHRRLQHSQTSSA